MEIWIDRYFMLKDQGLKTEAAITKVYFEYGLSSYDEDWLRHKVINHAK